MLIIRYPIILPGPDRHMRAETIVLENGQMEPAALMHVASHTLKHVLPSGIHVRAFFSRIKLPDGRILDVPGNVEGRLFGLPQMVDKGRTTIPVLLDLACWADDASCRNPFERDVEPDEVTHPRLMQWKEVGLPSVDMSPLGDTILWVVDDLSTPDKFMRALTYDPLTYVGILQGRSFHFSTPEGGDDKVARRRFYEGLTNSAAPFYHNGTTVRSDEDRLKVACAVRDALADRMTLIHPVYAIERATSVVNTFRQRVEVSRAVNHLTKEQGDKP